MNLTTEQLRFDRIRMMRYICERIPADGTTVIFPVDGGEPAWADLYPSWDDEGGWDLRIETNEPEWVGLKEVYDLFRRQEMTWGEWCSSHAPHTREPAPDPSPDLGELSSCAHGALVRSLTILAKSLESHEGPRQAQSATATQRTQPVSPYLDAPQAAAYLGLTVKALYGHVERKKLQPLPGYRRYRFTVEQLEAFLRGTKP